ncbi:MAG: pepsin/retropepsin-like aspartic protease family protein [Chthoniobacteraceae bacterium]
MKSSLLPVVFALIFGAVIARCQETAAGRDTVNVTITKQRKMLVRAYVNGVEGNFLVDTGAGNTYIGERFADSLRVPRSEGGSSYNVMGQMQFDVVNVQSFELGRNRIPLRHELIHVSNLGWINKSGAHAGGGDAANGILGADILIGNQAVIDCAQSQIRLDHAGARGDGAAKLTVNFLSRRGDELAVVARINGMAGTFIVDTGYNVSLLSPEFAYRMNAMARGGGVAKSHVISLATLEIGSNRIPVRHDQMIITSRVSIANQGYTELGEAPYDGVIGMDFLVGHHAVIDCGQMQMHVD